MSGLSKGTFHSTLKNAPVISNACGSRSLCPQRVFVLHRPLTQNVFENPETMS